MDRGLWTGSVPVMDGLLDGRPWFSCFLSNLANWIDPRYTIFYPFEKVRQGSAQPQIDLARREEIHTLCQAG